MSEDVSKQDLTWITVVADAILLSDFCNLSPVLLVYDSHLSVVDPSHQTKVGAQWQEFQDAQQAGN